MNHRNDQEVGMAHEVKSSENQPQFSHTKWGSIGQGPNKLSD